jgi:hypothetical protein
MASISAIEMAWRSEIISVANGGEISIYASIIENNGVSY